VTKSAQNNSNLRVSSASNLFAYTDQLHVFAYTDQPRMIAYTDQPHTFCNVAALRQYTIQRIRLEGTVTRVLFSSLDHVVFCLIRAMFAYTDQPHMVA